MSAPVACIGQLRIDRSLNSVMPVRQVQPNAVRITPVCSACCTQSSDHFQYCANSSRCWLSISCASNVETPARPAKVSALMPYCTASSMTLYLSRTAACDLLGGRARHRTDALGERQIRVAGLVHVEHVVDRAAVPVGQHRRDQKFHVE